MGNVVPFRRDVTPPAPRRSPDYERALFLLFEGRGVLRRLAESCKLDAGSPPGVFAALGYLDGAIEILDPDGGPDNAG